MPLQGLVNKWVKISKGNNDCSHNLKSQELSRSRHKKNSFSIKTETSTLDSIPTNDAWENESKLAKTRLPEERRRKSDILVTYNNNPHVNRSGIEVRNGYNLSGNESSNSLSLSMQELFNPLAQCGHLLPENCSKSCGVKPDTTPKRTHRSIIGDTGNSNRNRAETCPVEASYIVCDKCRESEHNLEQFELLTDYFRSLMVNNDECHHCQQILFNAMNAAASLTSDQDLHDINASSPFRSSSLTTFSNPVPIAAQEESFSNDHFESIALMESSRRLLDFMNVHKNRMEQISKERDDQQKSLDSKIARLTSMCKGIRQEISKNDSQEFSNASLMLMELESEIKMLKNTNHQNTKSKAQNEMQQPINAIPVSSGLHRRVSSNDKLSMGSSYKSNISCISESSEGWAEEGLMFDLDD